MDNKDKKNNNFISGSKGYNNLKSFDGTMTGGNS